MVRARGTSSSGKVRAVAVAGTNVTVLAMDANDDVRDSLSGFEIARVDEAGARVYLSSSGPKAAGESDVKIPVATSPEPSPAATPSDGPEPDPVIPPPEIPQYAVALLSVFEEIMRASRRRGRMPILPTADEIANAVSGGKVPSYEQFEFRGDGPHPTTEPAPAAERCPSPEPRAVCHAECSPAAAGSPGSVSVSVPADRRSWVHGRDGQFRKALLEKYPGLRIRVPVSGASDDAMVEVSGRTQEDCEAAKRDILERVGGGRGFKTSPARSSTPRSPSKTAAQPLVTSDDCPIQSFIWGDFTCDPGSRYTYVITPVVDGVGCPDHVVELTLRTESNDPAQRHQVFFNRGVTGQAYERKDPKEFDKAARLEYLSRGMAEGLLGFIDRAERGMSLKCCFYEFRWDELVYALQRAQDRGVVIHLVLEGKDVGAESQERIARCGGLERAHIVYNGWKTGIMHHKFAVLCDTRDRPVAVCTGSANMTVGGMHGQFNVVHIVNDPAVAAKYAEIQATIQEQGDRGDHRARNTEEGKIALAGDTSMYVSPRKDEEPLDELAAMIAGAEDAVCLTAPFGVHRTLDDALCESECDGKYLLLDSLSRGKTPRCLDRSAGVYAAVGATLEQADGGRVREKTSGLNAHVQFVHTKICLIDPLGSRPIVVTGSANFSSSSMKLNTENMLLISGNESVADVYFTEFWRLWQHNRSRSVGKLREMSAAGPAQGRGRGHWSDRFYCGGAKSTQRQTVMAAVCGAAADGQR
eukprot:TRINITY_DN17127_c0_g1_i1.p1 TRINITY_DN17127_c0_g1~~TRINITY_DN17127_c0_g1_i1.p1  ORF type:complete len:774 (+),score=136.21 TRINITY_DN17127_c0_g1_i1:62-2323(+)